MGAIAVAPMGRSYVSCDFRTALRTLVHQESVL